MPTLGTDPVALLVTALSNSVTFKFFCSGQLMHVTNDTLPKNTFHIVVMLSENWKDACSNPNLSVLEQFPYSKPFYFGLYGCKAWLASVLLFVIAVLFG